jgi:rhodanese-related sulfurtransferase
MLADSGFTHVINVNGGMTTFNLLSLQKQCTNFYETSNAYQLISPLNLCSFLSSHQNTFIIDVRTDSAFNALNEERENAYGKFKSAVHFPADMINSSLSKIPQGRPILVVNDFSASAATVANALAKAGYKNVNVLFNGLDALVSLDAKDRSCLSPYWEQNISYKTLTPSEFYELAKKEKNVQVVDLRPADEFNNQSKTSWRNIGIIKNAINVPLSQLTTESSTLDKNKPVLLYHFGGPDAFAAGKMLTDQGFHNVYVLNPGLFSLRWQAANLKGKSYLKDWVVNIPEENQ